MARLPARVTADVSSTVSAERIVDLPRTMMRSVNGLPPPVATVKTNWASWRGNPRAGSHAHPVAAGRLGAIQRLVGATGELLGTGAVFGEGRHPDAHRRSHRH